MASAALYTRELVGLGTAIMNLGDTMEHREEGGTIWGNITIKPAVAAGGEWLVILRATTPSGQYVAFASASSLGEALRGVSARLQNGSIKWTVDKYAR